MNLNCLTGRYLNDCARAAWLWSRWLDDWALWFMRR